jgi:uncharacterized protein (DUF433 family)
MRKKAFITGGLLVLMLLLSNTAFASTLQLNSDEITKIKTEINAGAPVKDVLKSHNISMEAIRSTLAETGIGKSHHKLTNTQIANIATKLGVTVTGIQAEIDAGKSMSEILKNHNLTKEQIRNVLSSEQVNTDQKMRTGKNLKRTVKAK